MNRLGSIALALYTLAGPVAASGIWVIDGVSTGTGLIETNHAGDLTIQGDLRVDGWAGVTQLRAEGVYDAAGRSLASIAVDSAVRYDVGRIWEATASPTASIWQSIAWSPKLRRFVAVSGNHFARSDDGMNWEAQDAPVSNARSVIWVSALGTFVVVTRGGNGVALSSDGINWSTAPTPPTGNTIGVAWSDALGLFVGVGPYRVATSEDGLTWSTVNVSRLWNDVIWVPELGIFVAGGSGAGEIGVSPDGENWTYPSVPANYFQGVTWAPELGLLVAVGSRGGTYASVIVSKDGMNWSEVAEAPKSGWIDVGWSSEARTLVAVSYNGELMTSQDAENWTLQTLPASTELWAIAWSPLLRSFVAGGNGAFLFSQVAKDVTIGDLTAQGRIMATGDLTVGGNATLGTAFGTNVISGDTQIGNSERRLDINQNGMFIMDAVTEDVAFAVEQYSPSLWRVDLKGNPLINAGPVTAESITLGGETRTQWNAQSENGPAFFFGNGDYLYADGTKLFYVSEAGVTNQVAFGGGPGAP